MKSTLTILTAAVAALAFATGKMKIRIMITAAMVAAALSGCSSEGMTRFVYGTGAMGDAMAAAAPATPTQDTSGGFLKPGYRLQTLPDGNMGVYDSQGYRGQVNGNGWYDNQGEGYTAWFMAQKHSRR